GRNHERREIYDEQPVPSRELEPRERVGGGRTGEHLAKRHGTREDRAVHEEPVERRGGERGGERLPTRAGQRRRDHIEERGKAEERDREADGVDQPSVSLHTRRARSTHTRPAGRVV